MYRDVMTPAIVSTCEITSRRRALQEAYNQEHGITPKSTKRKSIEELQKTFGEEPEISSKSALQTPTKTLTAPEIEKEIVRLEKEMKLAAKELRYEEAATLRDQLRHFESLRLLD